MEWCEKYCLKHALSFYFAGCAVPLGSSHWHTFFTINGIHEVEENT